MACAPLRARRRMRVAARRRAAPGRAGRRPAPAGDGRPAGACPAASPSSMPRPAAPRCVHRFETARRRRAWRWRWAAPPPGDAARALGRRAHRAAAGQPAGQQPALHRRAGRDRAGADGRRAGVAAASWSKTARPACDPADLPRLFEPLYRADAARSRTTAAAAWAWRSARPSCRRTAAGSLPALVAGRPAHRASSCPGARAVRRAMTGCLIAATCWWSRTTPRSRRCCSTTCKPTAWTPHRGRRWTAGRADP